MTGVCSVRFRSVCMGMANRNRPKWLEINRFRCISVFQREGYWDFQNHTISSKHKQNQHSTPNQDLLLLIQELTNPNSYKDFFFKKKHHFNTANRWPFFSKTEILDVLICSERIREYGEETYLGKWKFFWSLKLSGKKKLKRQETAEKVCGKMGCEEWKERPSNIRWFGVV